MRRAAGLMLVAMFAASCAEKQTPPQAEPAEPEVLPASVSLDPYNPQIEPANFDNEIDNPYMPWSLHKQLRYEGETEDGTETVEIEVLDETKEILGIDCVVVRDTVKVDGEITELTDDWYAQDDDGNVWYMGEDSHEYENGKAVNDAGSWEAGVDGAKPGIVMPGTPEVGQHYRQEFYEGEAEDTGEVIEVGETVTVPAGTYEDVVVTEDLNPLEPDVVENKYYAKGIGVVMEEHVKGGEEKLELVEVTSER